MPITVIEGSDYEPIAAGAYQATLTAVEGPLEDEKGYGRSYKFIFVGDDKKEYFGFGTIPKDKITGKEMPPTTKHKLGRWLCGLAGKPPQHMTIEPTDYIGKRYTLVYATEKGKTSLNTFTPVA